MKRKVSALPTITTAGACSVVATLAVAAASAGWAGRALPPIIAALIIVAALAGLVVVLLRQARAERFAAELSGDPAAPASLTASLTLIAARLDAVARRTVNTHPITNLPTRERLEDQVLEDLAAGGEPHLIGVIRFCDFDRLAAFDHVRANDMLRVFAVRLHKATRSSHQVTQVDRDCFCIYFRHAEDVDSARAEFGALVYVAGQQLSDEAGIITPCIEVGALAAPTETAAVPYMLLRILASLTRPTALRPGEILLTPPVSVEGSRDAFLLEQDIALAIAEEQLTMVFQPVVDLSCGRMIGAEALLRWEHPTLGFISPGQFIPIVETIGMGETYGLWVLNAACQQARAWLDLGLVDLKVAVNLSARQLTDPDLKTKVERTLKRHDLPPKYLELELTETAAMADAGRTRQLFGELRDKGISLAIDDFGSGYSSLSYLKNLPFDKLKIDREFITEVQDHTDSQAICKALIELGRGLKLKILAEGVETEAEVLTLRRLGCSVFQGYYFSKPLTAAAFIELAQSPQWRSRLERLSDPSHTYAKAPLSS